MRRKTKLVEKTKKETRKVKCPVEVKEEKVVKVASVSGYEVKMEPYEDVELVPETKLVEVTKYKTEVV